jgi:hypothetical protein
VGKPQKVTHSFTVLFGGRLDCGQCLSCRHCTGTGRSRTPDLGSGVAVCRPHPPVTVSHKRPPPPWAHKPTNDLQSQTQQICQVKLGLALQSITGLRRVKRNSDVITGGEIQSTFGTATGYKPISGLFRILGFCVSIVFLVDLRIFYQPVWTVFIRKLHNANVLVTGVQTTSRTNRCAAT